jgi:putative FmdB family regulatory protein
MLWEVPIYEYRCADCKARPAIFYRSLAAVEESPACPSCGGRRLTRLISRTAQILSEDSRMEAVTDSAAMAGVDESDPRSVARWARQMGDGLGDDELGGDFDETVDEMESAAADNGIEEGQDDLDSDL